MAELRGGTTIAGHIAIHSGLSQVYLAGNVKLDGKKQIEFTATNYGAPNEDGTSIGNKILLWKDSTSYYGIGIDASTLWSTSYNYHKWYTQGGVNKAAPQVMMTLQGSAGGGTMLLGRGEAIDNVVGNRAVLTIRGAGSTTNGDTTGVLDLTSSAADVDGHHLGLIQSSDPHTTGNENRAAGMAMWADGGTKGNRGGALSLYTKGNNASSWTERMRIIQNGNVGIGTSTPSQKLEVAGATQITANAAAFKLVSTTHSYMEWYPKGIAGGRQAYFGYADGKETDISLSNSMGGFHVKTTLRAQRMVVPVGTDLYAT